MVVRRVSCLFCGGCWVPWACMTRREKDGKGGYGPSGCVQGEGVVGGDEQHGPDDKVRGREGGGVGRGCWSSAGSKSGSQFTCDVQTILLACWRSPTLGKSVGVPNQPTVGFASHELSRPCISESRLARRAALSTTTSYRHPLCGIHCSSLVGSIKQQVTTARIGQGA